MESEGDYFAAKLCSGVDGAVAVGEVVGPLRGVDDAAANGGDDGGDADSHFVGRLLELHEAFLAEVARADPAVREVCVREPSLFHFLEDGRPGRSVGVVDVLSCGIGAGGELQEAAVMGQFSAV